MEAVKSNGYTLHWASWELKNNREFMLEIIKNDKSAWFLMNKLNEITYFENDPRCVRKYLTYPDWIFKFKNYDNSGI